MANSNLVSLKTQTEIEKFHNWLERNKNIYLADMQRMDRAYNIVRDSIEQHHSKRMPINTGLSKL